MKKTMAILLAYGLVTLFLVSPAMSRGQSSEARNRLYGTYIDKYVSRCESKGARINSSSTNISREAALYALKALYFKGNKEMLVKEMVHGEVGVKEHKIHYYLNNHFFNTVRKASLYKPSS